jgi:hypothetical protein
MKRYNLFGGTFIIEDDEGNIKYYIKEEVNNTIEEREFIAKYDSREIPIKIERYKL